MLHGFQQMHDACNTNRLGWIPDVPDHRDFQWSAAVVASAVRGLTRKRRVAIPEVIDLREFCGRVEDQQRLGTSTAHACIAMLQQFERRSTGRLIYPSRLFLHRAALRMDGMFDCRVSLRTALKACRRFGILDEKHWPYEPANLTLEPDAFTCGMSRPLRGLRYVRLDDHRATGQDILERLRSFLAAGFSVVFGFPIYRAVSTDAEISFPTSSDTLIGGQAVVAVGFDDTLRIRSDKGALLIRNSWGLDWGDHGFGWLPYSYITERLAADFWTLIKPSWLRSGEFDRPL